MFEIFIASPLILTVGKDIVFEILWFYAAYLMPNTPFCRMILNWIKPKPVSISWWDGDVSGWRTFFFEVIGIKRGVAMLKKTRDKQNIIISLINSNWNERSNELILMAFDIIKCANKAVGNFFSFKIVRIFLKQTKEALNFLAAISLK